jgi:ubiquinone/menaquinone biosynthesis C-methylase UbiE
MIWLIAFAVLLVIGVVLDREIYFYEGVHLGPRVQAWLYDRWSRKYDVGKRLSQLQDDQMLAEPLLQALHGIVRPFVLDFATGTGRLSHALVSRPEFQGHIVALDLSRGMLERAAAKLRDSSRTSHVELLRHQSLPLPFPDEVFDAVCALEVLELFPDMDEPMRELGRVLRPGGVLLTSRGTEESGRRAKVKSRAEFAALLGRHGFEKPHISAWWKLFDRVIAVKGGMSQPAETHGLSQVLRCPVCGRTEWHRAAEFWKCNNCAIRLPLTNEGILLS